MTEQIDELISELRARPSSGCVKNPYHDEICVSNLRAYFQYSLTRNSRILLIGEAPGHKGCAITGVPFTSEYVIRNSIPRLDGRLRLRANGNLREASATIVWSCLERHGVIPLMWNAFPFHPHGEGNLSSNRTPAPHEVECGFEFIHRLVRIFEPKLIVSVGKKAHGLLTSKGMTCSYVRHPSNGGSNEFNATMDVIFNKLSI